MDESEELLSKYFEADEAPMGQEAARERAFNEALEKAAAKLNIPSQALRDILLRNYQRYRKRRLEKEFPHLPRKVREE
jgi:hypothetical protein